MSVSGARRDRAADERPLVLLACVDASARRVFDDDVPASCAICGASIAHRPGALDDLPAGARPACLPCAARHAQQHDRAGKPATSGITRQTLDEVTRYRHEQTR